MAGKGTYVNTNCQLYLKQWETPWLFPSLSTHRMRAQPVGFRSKVVSVLVPPLTQGLALPAPFLSTAICTGNNSLLVLSPSLACSCMLPDVTRKKPEDQRALAPSPNMNETNYENGLPRGPQVKKGRGPRREINAVVLFLYQTLIITFISRANYI